MISQVTYGIFLAMKNRWIVGHSIEHVYSRTIYVVHRQSRNRLIAVYNGEAERQDELTFRIRRSVSLKPSLPDGNIIGVDVLCQPALKRIFGPAWAPGTNPENYSDSEDLPEWVVGDDPFGPGDETEPQFVVHTKSPRFVASIPDAWISESPRVGSIKPWDAIVEVSYREWIAKALHVFNEYRAAAERWRGIGGFGYSSVVQRGTQSANPLLTDEMWSRIEPLLPAPKPRRKGGPSPVTDRAALTGILFVLRTGCSWGHLPKEIGCGSGMTCLQRLRNWQATGIWPQIWLVLLVEPGLADEFDWDKVILKVAGRKRSLGALVSSVNRYHNHAFTISSPKRATVRTSSAAVPTC